MRRDNNWASSKFDFATLEILGGSAGKAHCAIDFQRVNAAGEVYLRGRVFYIVTRRDGRWGLEMRSNFGTPPEGSDPASSEDGSEARRTVLDFFTAFNSSKVDGVTEPLNYPHVFLTAAGARTAPDKLHASVRPDFDRMRESQGWHMSTIADAKYSQWPRRVSTTNCTIGSVPGLRITSLRSSEYSKASLCR